MPNKIRRFVDQLPVMAGGGILGISLVGLGLAAVGMPPLALGAEVGVAVVSAGLAKYFS